MRPAFAISNATNGGFAHTKSQRQFFARFIGCTNSKNVRVIKLSHRMPLTYRTSLNRTTLPQAIEIIVSRRSYKQMIRVYTRRIVAAVADKEPVRNGADKLLVKVPVSKKSTPCASIEIAKHNNAITSRHSLSIILPTTRIWVHPVALKRRRPSRISHDGWNHTVNVSLSES